MLADRFKQHLQNSDQLRPTSTTLVNWSNIFDAISIALKFLHPAFFYSLLPLEILCKPCTVSIDESRYIRDALQVSGSAPDWQ